jgi:hypothetical protein
MLSALARDVCTRWGTNERDDDGGECALASGEEEGWIEEMERVLERERREKVERDEESLWRERERKRRTGRRGRETER